MPLTGRDALRGEVPRRRHLHSPGLRGLERATDREMPGHGRPTRSSFHRPPFPSPASALLRQHAARARDRRTHAENDLPLQTAARPAREEASQPTPPPDAIAAGTGPHYTNWSRPISELV